MPRARQLASAEVVEWRRPGRVDYLLAYRAMQEFTNTRTPETHDEIWLLEHPPVFTMGLKGRNGERTDIHGIPLVYTDRGGDITYHGPGQLVAYLLLDLHRLGRGAKHLVSAMEQAVIDLLSNYHVHAQRRAGAPGVYVANAKIAALGLRVRQGASYHGIAFNLDMDLTPFSYIDPCGYPGLPVTQLADLAGPRDMDAIGADLIKLLADSLGYTGCLLSSDKLPPQPQ
ncbi:MAG: lipoyl(octanoyl) transferase LipB [Sulfuricaulis sp.]